MPGLRALPHRPSQPARAARLSAQAELRALRATQAGGATRLANARVTGASLRADAENCKAHNQRLRQQVKALEQRLSESLGIRIADASGGDAQPGVCDQATLRQRLEESAARVFELDESLAVAREELDAVREINRELVSQRNRATTS